jgi:hypothetical protein
MLVDGYLVDPRNHQKRSDITDEVSASGYTAGGQLLTDVTATMDSTNSQTVWTASNPLWPNATITATGAVVYKARGGDPSEDNLVSYIDFGGAVSVVNGTFIVSSFATQGFFITKTQ